MYKQRIHAKKAKCFQDHVHRSKKEASRCNELHSLLNQGIVKDLRIEVPFELIPFTKYAGEMKNERAVKYIADFVYLKDGTIYVEDVKGWKTPEYIIKRKLFKSIYCKDNEYIFIET